MAVSNAAPHTHSLASGRPAVMSSATLQQPWMRPRTSPRQQAGASCVKQRAGRSLPQGVTHQKVNLCIRQRARRIAPPMPLRGTGGRVERDALRPAERRARLGCTAAAARRWRTACVTASRGCRAYAAAAGALVGSRPTRLPSSRARALLRMHDQMLSGCCSQQLVLYMFFVRPRTL